MDNDVNRTVSYFFSGRTEGVMIVLQKLGKKEGFPDEYITREFVIEKLTELELTEYIEPIIQEYFTEEEVN